MLSPSGMETSQKDGDKEGTETETIATTDTQQRTQRL